MNVTTKMLVELIWREAGKLRETLPQLESWEALAGYGRSRGWLEEADCAEGSGETDRKTAARIVHAFLRKEWLEPEEADWSSARRLKDLYDCRVCTNHIAQVYAKGIMEAADGGTVFGMKQALTEEQMQKILLRMFHPEQRKPPASENTGTEANELDWQEALRRCSGSGGALLIDVRQRHEYEEAHLARAVCIPMAEVLRNPYGVTSDRYRELYFYCEKGYKSSVCANCMAQHGYPNVYYFSWKGTEEPAAEDGGVS